MIVVTGASGQLGRLVIASLLKKIPASQIIAAVRNTEKAADLAKLGVQVRYADYDKSETWPEALKGADRLLLISASEIGQRARQHRTVIDAAKNAGIELLAYTSVLDCDNSLLGLAEEHKQTEAYLAQSGVPYVLLRHGWYSENYTVSIPHALEQGAIYGCASEGKIASASRADFAEADALVITGENQAGKVYELAGDSAYTLTELAKEVSDQSNRSVAYVNLPQADYLNALLGAGLPQGLAELLADSDAAAAQGALFDDGRQLSALIGRPTTPISESVVAVL